MAHKTLIDGTSYSIVGGTTLVDGTSCKIVSGRTLIDGTGYDIPFKKKELVLLFKGQMYPLGYSQSSSQSRPSKTSSAVDTVYASDLGWKSFKDVETCRGLQYVDNWSGSYSPSWSKWYYSASTDDVWINPYPTEKLDTVCFCNEARDAKSKRTYSALDGDGTYFKAETIYASGSQYGGYLGPSFRELRFTYWDELPAVYDEVDGLIVANQTYTYTPPEDTTYISWSTVGVDTSSNNKTLPYNVYRLKITFVDSSTTYTAYFTPIINTNTGYSDFLLTRGSDSYGYLYAQSRGFQVKKSTSSTSATIKEVKVYYN